MPQYTIAHVADQVRDWPSEKGGAMRSYRVALQDASGGVFTNIEWARKVDSPAPTVGQKIEATIDERKDENGYSKYGPKLTLVQQGGGGGGGWRPKSPEELAAEQVRQRRIVRQHSQSMAIRWVEFKHLYGELPRELTQPEGLQSLIDWFYRDAMDGGQG